MGIRLDWDVESDLGHDSIEEDAAAVAKQKRRQAIRTRVVIGVVVLMALAAGVITWRLRIVNQEMERTLRATVEAESLALRIGDKHKFMQLQGAAEDWRAVQRETFDRIQAFQPRVVASGEIIDLKMAADEARVMLELSINGEPTEVIWLYGYTDRGWKHIASEQEPWRDTTTTIGLFTFTHNTMNRREVDDLAALFDAWWLIAARDTATLEPLALNINFDARARDIRWKNTKRELLLVPPDMLVRDASGEFDQETREKLAALVSEKWAAHAMNLVRPATTFDQWAVHQLAIQLTGAFGGHTEEQSAFVALADLYGENFVPVYLTEMKRSETPDTIAAMVNTMQQMAPPEVNEHYYEQFLEIIANLMMSNPNWLYNSGQSQDIFMEPHIQDPNQLPSAVIYQLQGMQPGTVHVEEIERFRDINWVTVAYQIDMNWWDLASDSPATMDARATFPFRAVDGYMKLASLRPEDWGQTYAEQSDFVTLQYPELDAETFAGQAPMIDAIYQEAAATFGIVEPPMIVMIVNTNGSYFDDNPHLIDPEIASPRVMCCYGVLDYNNQQLEHHVRSAIYDELFTHLAGPPLAVSTQQHYAIEQGLLSWVWEQHGQESPWSYEMELTITGLHASANFETLWEADGMVSSQDGEYQMMLDILGARELIEMLVEMYGEEAFVRMVQGIRNESVFTEWLSVVIGDSDPAVHQVLEETWRARFMQAVRDEYGVELILVHQQSP